MIFEGEPCNYLSHYGMVHGCGILEQFYQCQEEKEVQNKRQRRGKHHQRSVGCKCQLNTNKCGPEHGGQLFYVTKKKKSAVHEELNSTIKDLLGGERWGKRSKVCIRSHHFDQRVLNQNGEPYSYIHNEQLAREVYPDQAMFEKARVTNYSHLWKVLPTKKLKEDEDTHSKVGCTADSMAAPLEALDQGPSEQDLSFMKSTLPNADINLPYLDDDIAMNSDNSNEGEMDNYLSGNHLDQSQILLDDDGDINMSSARKKPPSLFLPESSSSNEDLGVSSMPLIQNTMLTASRSSEFDDVQMNPPLDVSNSNEETSVEDHSNCSPPIDQIIQTNAFATPLHDSEKDERNKGSTVRAGFENIMKRIRTKITTLRQKRKKTKTTGGPSPIPMSLDDANGLREKEEKEEMMLVSHINEILKLYKKRDGSIRKEANGLMIYILDKNLEHRDSWNKYEPIQISYIKPDSKKEAKRFILNVPVFKAESDHQRIVARGAKLLKQVVGNMAGENDISLQQAIVQSLATSLGGVLRWSQSTWLDVVDCMTLRERGRISSTKIIEILESAAKLLGIKNFCPKELHKKFREEHLKSLLEVAYSRIDLEGKQSIMYYIKNQPLLVERLLASSMMDGTYQKSEEFCNIVNSEIFLRGIDKGFEDISDLIRLVNRKDGNSGLYCIPICTVEDADETYENLAKTSFSDEIGKLMNQIYENKFHMLSIIGESKVTGGATEKDVRCVMIAFKHSDATFDAHTTLEEISVKTEQHISLSTPNEVEAFKNRSRHATNNDRKDLSQLEVSLDNIDVDIRFQINVQMVRVSFEDEERATDMSEEEERYDTFIGCQMSSQGKELFSFLFDRPIQSPCSTPTVDQQFSGHCRKLKIFNCDDGKMTANTCGLRTCNSTYSCPCCIRPTASLSIERWVEKYSERFGETVHILSLVHTAEKKLNHRAFRFEFQCNDVISYDQAHLNPQIKCIEDTNDILTAEEMQTFQTNSKTSDVLEIIEPINLSSKTLKKIRNCETDTFELNIIIRMVRAKIMRNKATPGRTDNNSGQSEGGMEVATEVAMEEVVSYIGCKIISILPNGVEEVICSIEFKSPFAATSPENLFGAQFRQAISLHCIENKMTNSIIGLKTCSSKPIIQAKFAKSRRSEVRKYLGDFQTNIRKKDENAIVYNFDTYSRREGGLSHEKTFSKGQELLGNNLEKTTAVSGTTDKATSASYSVSKKPLRYEDCNKYISDCLHAFEGMVTHLNETVRDLLKDIDERESYQPSSWSMHQHLEHTLERIKEEKGKILNSTEYQEAKSEYASNSQKIRFRLKSIKTERKKGDDEQDLSRILQFENEIEECESQITNLLEARGLGLMNRKIRGCSELEKEVNEHLKKCK